MTQIDPLIKARIQIVVTGRVQGVGFRASVLALAKEAGISGWVRNLGYNQVEAVAEGSRDKLEWFIEQMTIGPRGGRVDQSDIEWRTYNGEFIGFTVRSSR
jgi:acylphosphatase